MNLQQRLKDYVKDPEDPFINFELAREYFDIDQTAAALSFFIRAADRAEDEDIKYASLIFASKCYDRQGRRNHTTEGLLQHAVCVDPFRPEAYYFLSVLYEKMKKWNESRMNAITGQRLSSFDDIDVGYPGEFALRFQQAIAEWNVGLYEESRNILLDIAYKDKGVSKEIKDSALDNLKTNIGYPEEIPYTTKDFSIFKHKFPGIEKIEKNYSKHMQDMFVLQALNGKKNGSYLEIGSWHPIKTNNTYLLEKQFDWKGLSIEIDEKMSCHFRDTRKNPVVCEDATKIDYDSLLKMMCMPSDIDYLQVDCDDASLDILKRIPFDRYRFGIIQFEHDTYRLGNSLRSESRDILRNAGYKLVVSNVAVNEWASYEDWWIHPDIVDIREEMISKKDFNFVIDYMFETS